MLFALVTGALALTGLQQIDTTVAVSRGQRLDVNAFGGDVTVHAWNRNTIRIEANTSGRDRSRSPAPRLRSVYGPRVATVHPPR